MCTRCQAARLVAMLSMVAESKAIAENEAYLQDVAKTPEDLYAFLANNGMVAVDMNGNPVSEQEIREILGLEEPEIPEPMFTPAEEVNEELSDADLALLNEMYPTRSNWVEKIDDTLYISAYGVHMTRDVICKYESGITTLTEAIQALGCEGIQVISIDENDGWIISAQINPDIDDEESYPTTVTSF